MNEMNSDPVLRLSFIFIVVMTVNIALSRPNSVRHGTNLDANVSSSNHTSSERIPTSVRILTKPTLHRRGVPVKLQDESNQAIIFPDEEYHAHAILPTKVKDKPSCAKGKTFCEKIDGYPQELLNNILKHPSSLDNLFGVDDGPDEIANRLGEDSDIFLCRSEEKVIFPKIAKTKSNKWKYVVNQEDSERYVQGVKIERCIQEGKPCSLLSDLPIGYTSLCKQKYVYRKLITITDKGEATSDAFEMPSSCCCSYRKDVDFFTRIGTVR